MTRERLKHWGFRLGKISGIFALTARSAWRRRRLLILGYHGVSLEDEHLWNSTLFAPPSLLRERLELLQKNRCHVLPLSEGVTRLFEGSLPDRSVALTFDDGTYDFYTRAYPLLKEFGYPATVYLTTFYTYVQNPVPDPMLSYILWKGRPRKVRTRDLGLGLDEVNTATEKERSAAFRHMHLEMRRLRISFKEKNELIGEMAKRLGVDFDCICRRRILHLMRPDEIRAVADGGMDIQLHTHRHRVPRDRALFRKEICENRNTIRMIAARNDEWHFCYPDGDYDPRFFGWLRELGIRSATTCEMDLAAPSHHNYQLPRVLDTGQAPIEFEGWISGVASLIPRGRNGL